ncbi:unnamed protein product [Mycena citricolor]|uniref:Vacuolar protein-sorting-associated protein 36 n=1 Tax=Mycena citricolor TaxID=2018698 RepID=A0AAD2HP14_9AGAR|nr:unnamed protein product [Mycena citricolor]CAK5278773.1 unnamed protein product [Mycena citricolor]
MTLRRWTKPVDGTIPVQALLYDDEVLLATQDNVGVYDGNQKSPNHQSGTVYVSTHRLFYISSEHRRSRSFVMDLSYVTRTEHYAGLFKSSPKVTLYITSPTLSPETVAVDSSAVFESWECEVCGYRNPPGLSPAAARICGLCGISRDSVPAQQTPLSNAIPSSSSMPSLHESSEIACSACTFLNHPSLQACEICGTPLPRPRTSKSAPSSRPVSPDLSDDDAGDSSPQLIKISFRKGGDKVFYGILRTSLKGKAWLMAATPSAVDSEANRKGISGILKAAENSAQNRVINMDAAFQDIEALKVRTREMVHLAADLNEKLTALSSTADPGVTVEPEEATFIRSSLSQLGLQMTNAPVTQDMITDEERWTEQLAQELSGVLQGKTRNSTGLMRERGLIALDEVWGGWNRARGVSLLPPATMLQVTPLLPRFTEPPIHLRTLSSGMRVLHTPAFASMAFATRLIEGMTTSGPKTVAQIATEERIAIPMASELVIGAEADGDICRDDEACMITGGGNQTRYTANVFVGYVWDGHAVES